MRRLSTELPFTCVTCEVEITGRPTFHVGLPFCCAGCVADGPCICSYDSESAGGEVTGSEIVGVRTAGAGAVRYCLDLGERHPAEGTGLVGAGGVRR